MTRLKKLIRNLLLIAVLLFLFMRLNGLYFSPERALHASERDLNYGPSEIVHSFDYGKSRFFLARYENYFSFPSIDRALGVFWRYGGGWGKENEQERPLSFNFHSHDNQLTVFGMRNDPSITRVKVELPTAEGETIAINSDEFYEDMFFVMWKGEDEDGLWPGSHIIAYNVEGDVVYETDF